MASAIDCSTILLLGFKCSVFAANFKSKTSYLAVTTGAILIGNNRGFFNFYIKKGVG